jgi:SAM-dependent methyltransferase
LDADETQLVALWQANATPWTVAVRGGHIASRALATDRAVLHAVMACRPRRVLDVGCGEGWLSRALNAQGVDTLGLDAVPALVERAAEFEHGHGMGQGQGCYAVSRIGELKDSPLVADFDVWVCNFSLFHPDDGVALAAAAALRLPAGGALVVQTLHENATAVGAGSPDGWQPGSWGPCGQTVGAGPGAGFADPIPWYFRSAASWRSLLAGVGFTAIEMAEPCHPGTGAALSLLITARGGGGPRGDTLRP